MNSSRPTIVVFFNDWPVRPTGANCGGGEVATMSLAEAFAKQGYRVVACANLPEGETTLNGVEYWSFGEEYHIAEMMERLESLGPFYAFAATLVHPFLFLQRNERCLSRIVINHSPGIVPSGLEPRTCMHLVDYFVCVSEAQKKMVLSRGDVPDEKMRVIKNGFNPELFRYAGPEQRKWNTLMYAGRLEMSKGIHLLLGAFKNLKAEFPALQLEVFGDRSSWPDLDRQCDSLEEQLPGLKFHGKVPQIKIAQALQTAGIFVFPSTSFESAGLGVLDAQASGCPVVAHAVGGVPEYLHEGYCGLLVRENNPEKLQEALAVLLRDTDRLKQMSRDCARYARNQTWEQAASELLALASGAVGERSARTQKRRSTKLLETHEEFHRSWLRTGLSVHQLLEDHEVISSGTLVSDETLEEILRQEPELAIGYLWLGLRYEKRGELVEAKKCFERAAELSRSRDWQSLFRLVLLESETGSIIEAARRSQELLQLVPDFPLRTALEELVKMSEQGVGSA